MNNYNNGYNQNMNVNYNNNIKQPLYSQPLTGELAKKLMQGGNTNFTLQISEDDKLRSICTHKDPNRNFEFSLNDNGDGSSTCYICGKTFNIVGAKETVDDAVRTTLDVLQTIKTYYLDLPPRVASEYMLIIPMIEKIPQLFDIAVNNFNSHEVNPHNQYNMNNAAGLLNNILSPYGQMGGGYPMMNNGYPMGNGGYPMGGGGYPPMNNGGYPMNPNMNPNQNVFYQNPQQQPQQQQQFNYVNPEQTAQGGQQEQKGNTQNNQVTKIFGL